MKKSSFLALAAIIALAACETTIVPPGHDAPGIEGVTAVTPPEPSTDGTGHYNPDITAVGPDCLVDDDCLADDACDVPGGCDGDPCRDDRCVVGQCMDVDIEGCDPGYQIRYSYSACCPERILSLAPDGRCTFQIEGEPALRCEDIAPVYLKRLVDHAGTLGFFYWDGDQCVPGVTQADFSLYMQAGDFDNHVICEQGVCVGELCNVLDGVWATLPPNWQDGCSCE